MQNIEHRRGSWDRWWSTNCTHVCMSRKSLWPCYFYPAAKDRIQPRNYFSLWDFMTSLLARNCCCAHAIQDTYNAFLSKLVHHSHIYEKGRVWRASENSNYRFNIKAFKYFLTEWGKQINLPRSKQLCLSSQDPNAKHEWWSTYLGARFSEVLRSHKLH